MGGTRRGTASAAVARVLRNETAGGAIMLTAAVIAVVWASSPWSDSYFALRDLEVGPEALHLHLSLGTWASDGLLAIFFFVAGTELKRELVAGELRDPAKAALPVVAALSGMVAPALVFVLVASATGGSDALHGWAIPTATDIAFALAVLAVIQSHLPPSLRAFLLTLAVVDDLGAILIIAIVYTSGLGFAALAGATLLCVLYAGLQHLRVRAWWCYVPIAVAVWGLVHASGVHATVAGMILALLTRARRDEGEPESPAERVEHRLSPWSAGIAVPVFALFAAGVPVSLDTVREAASTPAALAVAAGLVIGKPLGVLGGSWLAVRFTRAKLSAQLRWADLAALAVLAGVGFTVSLLITELSFGTGAGAAPVKMGVLGGSLVAAAIASVLLVRRNAAYRALE